MTHYLHQINSVRRRIHYSITQILYTALVHDHERMKGCQNSPVWIFNLFTKLLLQSTFVFKSFILILTADVAHLVISSKVVIALTVSVSVYFLSCLVPPFWEVRTYHLTINHRYTCSFRTSYNFFHRIKICFGSSLRVRQNSFLCSTHT